MLPGLQKLLDQTPKRDRNGWVVNPLPIDYQMKAKAEWFKPTRKDLARLAKDYSNSAVARACSVSETTVRKWLTNAGIRRAAEYDRHHGDIDEDTIAQVRRRAERLRFRKPPVAGFPQRGAIAENEELA